MTNEGYTAGGKRRNARSYAAEAKFRARVAELGGEVLEESWKGVKAPHRVRCAKGHEGAPRPQSINIGNGLCEVCGYQPLNWTRPERSYAGEAKFRARVAELGGEVLEESWKGNGQPHRVRCANGHEGAPRPSNVLQGSGICLTCSWSSQDTLYVVVDDTRGRVKLGITTTGSKRLHDHARDGFTNVVAVRQGLPTGAAHAAEQSALKSLRASGVMPVQGREYFDAAYTLFILAVLGDNLH